MARLTLTNAEKQARYRERHLGVDGEKVRVGLNLNADTRRFSNRCQIYRFSFSRRWSSSTLFSAYSTKASSIR